MKKRFGFTLAEVLITLGIIGVVAALTIPTLISKYQKQEYVTQLKKAYSQFNEALQLMSKDRDCINDLKCTDIFLYAGGDQTQASQIAGDELVKYFKVVKNCGTEKNLGCFTNKGATNYDGSDVRTNFDEWDFQYRFITTDGTAFSLYSTGLCDDVFASNYVTGNMTRLCGYLYIDVNGPTKGPNNMGRDIFWYFITNGKGALLYPAGGADEALNGWWRNSNAEGDYRSCYPDELVGNACAGRIMEEGWQMNY